MSSLAFHELTKRYGNVTAIDGLTARGAAGRVTAFLGANGSGKTTSMRLLLGLSAPTCRDRHHRRSRLPRPSSAHAPRRSGARPGVPPQPKCPQPCTPRGHAGAGFPGTRGRAPRLVGLSDAADRKVGGFSLGMRQRLALASALVGAPESLVLDEPFNGLDPDGIAGLKAFLRRFADDGGTVLLSSHCWPRSRASPTTC